VHKNKLNMIVVNMYSECYTTNKDILSFPVKRMLFFALFQSQVSYGIRVWGRTYHYLINGI
jgi:hypothetical protein